MSQEDAEPAHPHHDPWQAPELVARWLERHDAQAAERRQQFAIVRAVIPRLPDQAFAYVNLGAGPGYLDEVLLAHFTRATATLVDVSAPMLGAARARLDRFASRVEYVQTDLSNAGWLSDIKGHADVILSMWMTHDLRDADRIRALYREAFLLLGDGGLFLNLDFVRPAHDTLAPLAGWAATDPEAGLRDWPRPDELPGSLREHQGWLDAAGFDDVDVLWKDLTTALLCGTRGHIAVPVR